MVVTHHFDGFHVQTDWRSHSNKYETTSSSQHRNKPTTNNHITHELWPNKVVLKWLI
ncbi:hypothetical protein [Candidatus Hodgkinia cicadicola]|uniref:hypothetical protein n=1 Tax=Candidatus Hodgkinia cicadicola TaxID=573658 RepID=UPI001788A7F2